MDTVAPGAPNPLSPVCDAPGGDTSTSTGDVSAVFTYEPGALYPLI